LAVVAVIRRLVGVFGAVPPVGTVVVVVVVVVVPPLGRAAAAGAISTATRTGTLHATTQRRIDTGSSPPPELALSYTAPDPAGIARRRAGGLLEPDERRTECRAVRRASLGGNLVPLAPQLDRGDRRCNGHHHHDGEESQGEGLTAARERAQGDRQHAKSGV
jgi:hypothetical protein